MTTLRVLTAAPARGEDYLPTQDQRIAGNPRQSVSIDYSDRSGKFMVGIWRCEPGKWKVSYTEDEYCRLLEGVCVVTDAAGQGVTLRAGDEFVMPRGFVGTWEVLQSVVKRFVIYEPGSDAISSARPD